MRHLLPSRNSCVALVGQFKVGLEFAIRLDFQLLQLAVVGLAGFRGAESGPGRSRTGSDKGELMFAVVDLAAEKGGSCAVLLGLLEQRECVVRRPAGAAENSRNKQRVVSASSSIACGP